MQRCLILALSALVLVAGPALAQHDAGVPQIENIKGLYPGRFLSIQTAEAEGQSFE